MWKIGRVADNHFSPGCWQACYEEHAPFTEEERSCQRTGPAPQVREQHVIPGLSSGTPGTSPPPHTRARGKQGNRWYCPTHPSDTLWDTWCKTQLWCTGTRRWFSAVEAPEETNVRKKKVKKYVNILSERQKMWRTRQKIESGLNKDAHSPIRTGGKIPTRDPSLNGRLMNFYKQYERLVWNP